VPVKRAKSVDGDRVGRGGGQKGSRRSGERERQLKGRSSSGKAVWVEGGGKKKLSSECPGTKYLIS